MCDSGDNDVVLCVTVSDVASDIYLCMTGPTFRDRCSIPVSDSVAYRT